MATVGSLAVNVIARTEKFVKGITKARTTLGTFSSKLSGASKLVAGFGAGAVLAGGAVATHLVKNQFSAVDAIAKTSDKLGIATEKLAAYRLAASRTGVSNESLEGGLEKMLIRISDAAQGTGEAVGALQELGLSAALLNKMSPDQQFESIAGAMSRVQNQADKVRLAYEVFGRSGTDLVNTLKLGVDGLRQIDSWSRRSGQSVSREMAAGVESANDEFAKLLEVFTGAARQIAVRMAPIVQRGSQMLSQFFTDEGRVHSFADAVVRSVARSIQAAIRGIHEVRIALADVIAEASGFFVEIGNSPLAHRLGVNLGSERMRKLMNVENRAGLRAASLRHELETGQDPAAKFGRLMNGVLSQANGIMAQGGQSHNQHRQQTAQARDQLRATEETNRTLRDMRDRMTPMPAANFAG